MGPPWESSPGRGYTLCQVGIKDLELSPYNPVLLSVLDNYYNVLFQSVSDKRY